MALVNAIQPLQIQPNRNVLQPGQSQPRAIFFLRGAPGVITAQWPGGAGAISLVGTALVLPREAYPVRAGVRFLRLAQTNPPLLQASGLVHARALGDLKTNPKLALAGLDHARTLSSLVVVTPPVVPPVTPPPTTPATPVSTPRNLRYVRTRNRPDRD